MDPVTVSSVLALLVSAASFALSWMTATRQHGLTERQAGLQERLLEVEMSRDRDRLKATKSATVTASVAREVENWRAVHVRPARVDHFLQVENEGPAGARNIEIRLDGDVLASHRLIVKGEPEVTSLGPGAIARYFWP